MTDHKVIVILGPRQVGKTTLLNTYFEGQNVMFMSGDDIDTREQLEYKSVAHFKRMLGDHTILVIDEAQRIADVGISLKQMHDHIRDVKILVTGSSALDLRSKINEPLTGRKWEYTMYPLSFEEMVNHHGYLEEKRLLEHRMLYGYYPDVVTNFGDEVEILKQLSDSYLYKDILTIDQIKKPGKLEDLLRAIAFQVGSEVSYHELGQLVGLHPETVERYIDLFKKMFILVELTSYSRNLRNEIKKGKKFYFFDLGIRNAVINNFNPLKLRNDVGALWENFIILERLKYKEYHRVYGRSYFWRTHAQQEIDYLEERDGTLYAYEFKWNPKKKAKLSKAFERAYTDHTFEVITPDNYYDFIVK